MHKNKEVINELLKMQKNKPKQEASSRWSYATERGGYFRPFEYPVSDSAIRRMENEVTNVMNWERDKEANENYTAIRTIPPFSYVRIHSLKFPDGRVWDSTIRKFRYEQKNG